MINECLKKLQNWLLPCRCLLCRGETGSSANLCAGCLAALPTLTTSCARCAIPLGTPGLCGRCQAQPPSFQHALAALRYQAPIDRLILGLKYQHRLIHARALGELLAEAVANHGPSRADCIMPMPLHPDRLRQRGYNQALEIARPVAQRLGLPIDYHSLLRIRATPAQSGLRLKERARNVRNAFGVCAPVDGARIALVDDVMTSTHTAQSAARSLLKAGAREVSVWVVARAV